jgi:hypothetical protein
MPFLTCQTAPFVRVNHWHDVSGRCASPGLSLYRREWVHVYFICCEAGHLTRFFLIEADNVIGFTWLPVTRHLTHQRPRCLKGAGLKNWAGKPKKEPEAIKQTTG